MRECNIEFDIKGNIAETDTEQSYDLCTIVSNLLKNAIEACKKIPIEEKREIQLIITSMDQRIYMCVKNSVNEKVKLSGKYPKTTKVDQKNHGLGYKNLELTVQKYDGEIECHSYEDNFEVEIML